ncbi:hypothetical protein KY340_00205 [Candidatus Woesearchaeota archaeon]|nr:hypothetical protein [Candidatus Woesearchaeota archaeon]
MSAMDTAIAGINIHIKISTVSELYRLVDKKDRFMDGVQGTEELPDEKQRLEAELHRINGNSSPVNLGVIVSLEVDDSIRYCMGAKMFPPDVPFEQMKRIEAKISLHSFLQLERMGLIAGPYGGGEGTLRITYALARGI